MRFLKFILTFILILSAFAGDNLVFKSKYSDSIVFRAVTDTLVHGFIGLLSAALFFSHKLNFSTQTCLLNTLFCTVMSSIIDLDHVFVAKSFHFKFFANPLIMSGLLQRDLNRTQNWTKDWIIIIIWIIDGVALASDLTNLTQRGIFHCTTFWILISVVLLTYSYVVRKVNLFLLTFMIILAFTSHHIRDGNRRGLWLYPYGNSPPINKYLYSMLIGVLPNVFAYIFSYLKIYFKENVEYSNISVI